MHISPKILDVLEEFRLASNGGRPLWNDLLMLAQRQLIALAEKQTQSHLVAQLKSMLFLKEASLWSSVGSHSLS